MIKGHLNSIFTSLTYSVGCEDVRIIIDPGDEWENFQNISSVLLTHAHFDHVYGLNELSRINPDIKVYTNDVGREMLFDAKKNLSRYHETPFVFSHPSRIVVVNDGDEIEIGESLKAKAFFTPGHNPSCITWQIGDALFTGDSYIPGIKTVTNLPGGNKHQDEESIALIKKLAIGRTIYPGHKV